MPLSICLDYKFAAILLFLLLPQSSNCKMGSRTSDEQSTGTTGTASDGERPTMSDRERAGLRGPVEQCTEETITPSGSNYPAMRYGSTTKYDPTGRILHISYTHADGSKSMGSHIYDTQGHLLKAIWGRPSGPASETNYTYDEKGRLIGMTGDGEPRQSSTFQYDDQGRKTRIVKSELKPSSSGTDDRIAVSFDAENDDLFMPAPVGGLVKTLFNERDQPTESQIYEANGHLTSRLVRRYDAKGRVSESDYVIEDIKFILPAEAREQLMAEPGASEELKKQLIQLLGAQREFSRNSYIYDAEGRVTEKHFRVGAHQEMITKITYNDNGDKMQEHTTTVGDLNPTKSAEGSEIAPTARASVSPQESEVRYGYQYDSFGNWIEQTISSRPSPSEPFTTSTVHHRTITYY